MTISSNLPSINLSPIIGDISSSRQIAKTIQKQEVAAIDATINQLNLRIKELKGGKTFNSGVAVARGDVTLINNEIRALKNLKKQCAKTGIQTAAQATSRREIIASMATSAFTVIESTGGRKQSIDEQLQKLRESEKELDSKMDRVFTNLNGSLSSCLQLAAKYHLFDKPESRFSRIKNSIRGLFHFGEKDKPIGTLDGMAQQAKKILSTSKMIEAEVNKTIKGNKRSMESFNKQYETELAFVNNSTKVNALRSDLATKASSYKKHILDSKKMSAYHEQRAVAAKSLEQLDRAKTALDNHHPKDAKAAIKEYHQQFEFKLKLIDENLKEIAMLQKGWSSWIFPAAYQQQTLREQNRIEILGMRDQISGGEKILEALEKGTPEGRREAEQLLNSLRSQTEAKVNAYDSAFQRHAEAKVAVTELDHSHQALDNLKALCQKGKELVSATDYKEVAEWQRTMKDKFVVIRPLISKTG